MRSLFIVGSKILGILFIYWFLLGLAGLVTTIEHLDSIGSHLVFTTSFSLIITLVFGLLLLFKNNPLVEYLGLRDDEKLSTDISYNSVLKVGVILIGIYVFTDKVGTFLKILFDYINKIKAPKSVFAPHWITTTYGIVSTVDVILQALVIGFALFLIFESAKVIKLINKIDKKRT